jgi:hypothetical protein
MKHDLSEVTVHAFAFANERGIISDTLMDDWQSALEYASDSKYTLLYLKLRADEARVVADFLGQQEDK